METKRSSTLQEKVLHLQRAYLAKLPQSLALARESMTALTKDAGSEPALAELYRCFHNIKGTSASLGLQAISEQSSAAVELVAQLQHLDVTMRRNIMASKLSDLMAVVVEIETQVSGAPLPETERQLPARSVQAKVWPGTRPGSARGRIFLYDVAPDAEQLVMQLSCFGYHARAFPSLADLRAAVLDDPPDAVVLTTDGADLAADLRSRILIPFLFISERDDFATRLKAVQAGGEAFFLKPTTAHELVDTLDQLTTRREPDPFRVLIIDDEPEMADYLSLILESTGMLTRQLDEPARILDVLAGFQPDLVLMDMYMPICSGREYSSLIRQIPQFVSIPIIFLSSETDKSIQLSAMKVGADGFLTKPILPDDLISAVVVRAERTRTLRSLMMRDSLTGLLNHTTLTQFLGATLAAAQRHDGHLCFAMLDVDHFKRVNDSFGHPAGDQVLVALARMLKQRLRNSDMVGRYGGEEFAIILQNVSEVEAVNAIGGILRDFSLLKFKAGETEFSCTFSAGVAGFPGVESAEQLVFAADLALYGAKHAGRNRIVTASQIKDQR